MRIISQEPIQVKELYYQVSSRFESPAEFIETLDALYALNKVKFNEEREVLEYVD